VKARAVSFFTNFIILTSRNFNFVVNSLRFKFDKRSKRLPSIIGIFRIFEYQSNAILSSYQDDERSKGDTSQLHHLHHELQRSLVTASSIEEEPEDPIAPLKNPKDDSK
jgi:hypothetical protein